MKKQPTALQIQRWMDRARVIHDKAAALFNLIEARMGEDDKEIVPIVGDTMVSAWELKNNLEGWHAEATGPTQH